MGLSSRMILVLGLLTATTATLSRQPLAAATYYVRTIGSDTNDGTSAATAFKTITKAATVAQAGDTVWIGAGVYNNSITPSYSGTSASPIKFCADTWGSNTGDGGGVVVSGSNAALVVNGKNYIQVIGLQFGGGTAGYGGESVDEDDESAGVDFVRFTSCVGGMLKDCDIRYGDDAIRVSSAEVTVDGTYIEDHTRNGIRVEGSTSKLTVLFSIIGLCGYRGIYIRNASEVTVEATTIYNNGNHGLRSEASSSSSKLTLRRCHIYGNLDGLHLHAAGSVTLENCLVRNNREEGMHDHSGGATLTIRHCTFVKNRDGICHDSGTATVTNTICAQNTDDGIDRNGGTLTNSYCCSYGNAGSNWEGTSAGTGSLTSDPKFTSSTDFHLQASSPCIDVGTGSVTVDLEGTTRPMGPAVDMGCYEAGSGGGGSGKTYYVRMSGSDRRDGLSAANAFRTLGKAVTVVTAGDTVWVGAGTYSEAPSISGKTGSAASPITFNADTDGAKTGDAGSVNIPGGFYVQNSSYVNLRLFTLQPGTRKASWSAYYVGVHLSGTSNILLQGLSSTGGSHGILAENAAGTTVSSCVVQSATTHGYCFQGTTTATVTSCQATGSAQAGFYVTQGTVALSGCTSSGNGTRGYHYSAAGGSLSNCSSTSDYRAAELTGINNDRNSLVASNFTVQSSQNGGLSLQVCTAQVLGGALPLCSSGPYGIYVDNASLMLNNATVSGTQYGVQIVNAGNAVLTNCTIANCQYEGVLATAATMSLSSCTVSGCRNGIKGETNSSLSAVSCTVSGHSDWGIHHSGTGSVNGCVLTGNDQGLYLAGHAARGDVTVLNTSIDQTAREGLVAIRCTGNVSGGAQRFSQAGDYGAYLEDSQLTLSDFEIQGPAYGVTAYASDVVLSGGTISSCSVDAIYRSGGSTTVSNCTLSSCRYGIRSENGGTLSVSDSTLSNNSSWAIHHTGFGAIEDCVVTGNQQGLYLVGAATRGDITLSNNSVQGTTAEGVNLTRCTGTFAANTANVCQGGAYSVSLTDSEITWPTPHVGGTQYGVLSYGSTLTMTDGVFTSSQLDHVYAENSTLNLTQCAFSLGRSGVQSLNNSTLNAAGCTFTGQTSWAIVHAGFGSVNDCQATNCARGVSLTGAAQRGDITIADTVIEGATQEGLVAVRCTGNVSGGAAPFSQGGTCGLYLLDSDLAVANVQIEGAGDGVQCTSSELELTNATISGMAQDGIVYSQSTVQLASVQVSGCRYGLVGSNGSTLVATATSIDQTTAWGVYHSGYGTLTNVSVNDCQQGMYLVGQTQPTDVQLANVCIQGTAHEGLAAVRCSGQVVGGAGRLSGGGAYGASLSQANLTLTDVSILGTQNGIVADQSTLVLQDSDITAVTQTGILATGSTLTLTSGLISDCGGRGLDCQAGSTLNATSCRVELCGDWGVVLEGFGTLTSCVVEDNGHGAFLTGSAQRGDIALVNLSLNGSAGQGLVAVRCDGDVLGGASFSGGGDWGLYAHDSQLTLSQATLSGSTYGVYSSASDLTVRDSHITGAHCGVYSTTDESLTLQKLVIENSATWAVQAAQGSLHLSNCVARSNTSGLLLQNMVQANIWNVTLAGCTQHGVRQDGGSATLRNTIVSGTNQGVGVHVVAGALTESHNLVHGFATSFSGLTPHDTTQVKNPRFVNPGAGDYRLSKASPAINAGFDLAGLVDQDLLGQARPTYRRWEIGAYEYLQDDASLRILDWTEQR